MTDYTIRPLRKEDNADIAQVIRTVLEEHKMNKPGTVYTDPTTDNLFQLFQTPKSSYSIVEMDGEVVGGCGIYPTKGLPDGCVELVKLYLLPKARGKGLGRLLLNSNADIAKAFGYRELYLESMPELSNAVGLYESTGYKILDTPMGDSGHYACDLWMLKSLD